MAHVSIAVIDTLRATASKIESDTRYQWGHMGLCNCGFLAQEITKLSKSEIHTCAMQRHGDWTEQLNDYCPTSGLPMDQIIDELIAFGFSADDLRHLEKLSDGQILRSLPIHERNLHYNIKRDVVKYLRTWANLVEDQLLGQIKLLLNEERPELVEA
ncbi:MAG: hypothetical protein IM574_09760 [Cytophagales bacterium]|jgi:hypothetical protein|nr:hypothetical protein [Cytophagales bacterium]MCA6387845.1 hypothetical protein [Cytophagales bacterium]MCA6391425.1 hypothetical protein [Cytophagales bacterium]MCA6394398.1 hypothetical protein [Cytophagales bacterium]MCA6398410.1 hypothetical protein [Cytophagales bacterium]